MYRALVVVLGVIAITLSSIFASVSPVLAAPGINKSLNYQGKLLSASGVPVANGTYSIKFTLYDASTNGNALWTAAGTVASPTAVNVSVTSGGLFSVLLGSAGQNTLDAVPWNTDSLYLGVTIGTDSEMTPRKRLGSVPQAFNSESWNGYKTATSVASGENVLKLSQTSSSNAASDRTTLVLTTSGTSNGFDYLLKGTDNTLGDVFTINRQGNVTSSGNIATNGNVILGDSTSDTVVFNAQIKSDLIPQSNDVYSLGSTSLRWRGFFQNVTSTNADITTLTGGTGSFTTLTATTSTIREFNFAFATGTRLSLASNGLTVGGVNVCLSDSTNCPASSAGGSDDWTYSTTSDFVRPNTNTTSLVLGGSTPGTSPFYFQIQSSSSRLYLGGFGSSTNIVLGGTTSTITNTMFQLDGNDFYTAGNIGAASSVYTNGAFVVGGTTFYGDGFINSMNGNLNVTSSQHILLTPTGNVGIGTSTPSEKLSVVGNIANVMASGTVPVEISETTIGTGSDGVIVQGKYAYVANGSASTLSVVDISDPLFPKEISEKFIVGGVGNYLAVNGRYAYLTQSTSNTVAIVDVSNPTALAVVTSTFTGSNPLGIYAQGRYIYVVNQGTSSSLSIIDVADPTNPVRMSETFGGTLVRQVYVQGNYAYVAGGGSLFIFNVENPARPALVGTAVTGSGAIGVYVQGRYAYVTNLVGNSLSIVDVSNPNSPAEVAERTVGGAPVRVFVQGRYAYLANSTTGLVSIWDVSSSTQPTIFGRVPTGSTPTDVFASGRYLYVANSGDNSLSILRIPGTETSSLLAHSGEAGTLMVDTNATIGNNLNVAGGLEIGQGGILSTGAIGISSTNTTSTITFAVSSTKGIFSDYILVNNQKVCLANGTNCPVIAGSGFTDDWTYSTTNDFVRPATNSTSLVLGGSTPGTAPFYFQIQSSSSRLYLGAFGSSTNVVLGGTTSTISNTMFQLDGNDFYTAGNIGSASSVYTNGAFIAGTGSMYGDGFITRTTGSITVTSSQDILFTPSGNVGIGTSTPNEKLTVVGNVQNTYVSGTNTGVQLLGSVTVGNAPFKVVIQGDYAYIANETDNGMAVVSVADPLYPKLLSSVGTGAGPNGVFVAGRYAYVANTGGSTLSVIDVSNPSNAVDVADIVTGSGARNTFVSGKFAYVVNFGANTMNVVDIGNPTKPVVVATSTTNLAGPRGIFVSGKYAYIGNLQSGTLAIYDVSNPLNPIPVSSIATDDGAFGVTVQGRYAYVSNFTAGTVSIVDVSDPANPVVKSEIATGTSGREAIISGRYLYTESFDASKVFVLDVASSTNPIRTAIISVSGSPSSIAVKGRYLYVTDGAGSTMSIYRLPGMETSSLLAHSLEAGTLTVDSNATIANNLNVGTGLEIGQGGILSTGAIGISSTNTTSTITFAVSSTRGIFDQYILVNNKKVCLANGTNCPAIAGGGFTDDWTYSTTNDFVRPATNSTSLVLGGSTPGTSPFYFQIQSSSSRLYLGAFGSSTNVVLGGTTSTITSSMFQLDGNDFYTAGNIGSASSVYTNGAFIAGTGSMYGDGFITRTNGNIAVTSSQNILLAPSGNVGIGTSTPSEKLTVVGNISNLMTSGTGTLRIAGTATVSAPDSAAIQGNYAYLAVCTGSAGGLDIVDVSNPAFPKRVSHTTFGICSSGPIVSGRYVYLNDDDGNFRVIDVSNPTVPVVVAAVAGANPSRTALQGRYVYMTTVASLAVYDVINPTNPVRIFIGTIVQTGARGVAVQGRYAYVSNHDSNSISVVDITNPAAPINIANYGTGISSPDRITVQGRYVYLENDGDASVKIIDVSNPVSPRTVASMPVTDITALGVSGRYIYAGDNTNGILHVFDVASSTAPIEVGALDIGSSANGVAVSGRYVYATVLSDNALQIVTIPGLETSSLLAHSLEAGSLTVDSNATIANNLNVAGALEVGAGGILSTGAIGISSTNTTSTITFAVSSTRGIFDQYILVNNKKVCLANGTNCPAIAGGSFTDDWTYSTTNDFLRPNTNTTGLVLGGSTSGTAPFAFMVNNTTGSSRLYLGAGMSATDTLLNAASDTASSNDVGGNVPGNAIDGDTGSSRWASWWSTDGVAADQWLYTDYGATKRFSSVDLWWEAAYATSYLLQVSDGPQPSVQRVAVSSTASSVESGSSPAGNAIDKDFGTRWASDSSDPQWIYVDLGSSVSFNRIELFWESAYGDQYELQISDDASSWVTVSSTVTGDGGQDEFVFPSPLMARYVRMNGTHRATAFGYSLYEFQVWNDVNSWTTIYSTNAGAGGHETIPVSASGRYLRVYATQGATAFGYSLYELQATGRDLYGADVLLGASNSTINNSLFQLDGNDLFAAGNIGSASSVYTNGAFIAGTGSMYGDGFITKMNGSLTVTSSQDILLTPSGNVGIGTSTPNEKLTVVGNISNLMTTGTTGLRLISSSNSGATNGANLEDIAVQGNYAYLNTDGAGFVIQDISNPAYPKIISSTAVGGGINSVIVSGRYLYTEGGGNTFYTYDISNPTQPTLVGSTAASADSVKAVAGKYAFLTSDGGDTLTIVDVSDPTNPAVVSVTSGYGFVLSAIPVGNIVYLSTDLGFSVVDITNPTRPVTIGSTDVNINPFPEDSVAQGRYVYLGDDSSAANTFQIVDVANPAAPVVLTTVPTGADVSDIAISGRYVYALMHDGNLGVWDVASSTNVVNVQKINAGAVDGKIAVVGRYLYLANSTTHKLDIYLLPGIETSSLLAHSLEAGTLTVDSYATIANNLNVAGALEVGQGGILSTGAIGISSTNTTSTITYAVSSTKGIFSDYILVNNKKVCLANGTNCPAIAGGGFTDDWTYSATNDFVRPATNSTSLVLGGSTPGTSPFYFQIQSSSSRLYLGAFGSSTNVVLGGTTSTITNTMFQLDGNDFYTAGNIGSASSVYTNGAFMAGTGSIYGDGFITRTTGSIRVTSSQDILFTPTGNVGIGTSTPSEKLTVVGNVQNIYASGTLPQLISSTSIGTSSNAVTISGKYAYVLDHSNATLSIVDVSNPSYPVKRGTLTFGDVDLFDSSPAVNGRYLYFASSGSNNFYIVDISNPSAPTIVYTLSLSGARGVAVSGKYAYVAETGINTLAIVDISNPLNPSVVSTIATGLSPDKIAVQGAYVFVANNGGSNSVSIFDVSNPSKPVLASTAALPGVDAEGVAVSGRYLYVSGDADHTLNIVDISDLRAPSLVSIVTSTAFINEFVVSGRYVYIPQETFFGDGSHNGVLSILDVSSSTAPVVVSQFPLGGDSYGAAISGDYLYVPIENLGTLNIFRLPGTETSSLLVHSLEAGTLTVDSNATIANNLNVAGALEVGQGGVLSTGALGISSTNTTSTIVYAVSSTKGIFSDYILVNNKKVCLADGTNCAGFAPAASTLDWTYSQTNDFVRPNTSTTSLVLGGSTAGTAPFYFQIQSSSSRLYLGAFGSSTNVVIGRSTSTITNTSFQLDGNDLFVAGNIGSASSVYTNGAFIAGSDLYGDGFINSPNNSIQVTSSQDILLTPTGNVGVGTSTPNSKLTVMGNISNKMDATQTLRVLATSSTSPVKADAVEVQGQYAYWVGIDDSINIVDISNPSVPHQVGSKVLTGGGGATDVVVRGKYAYVSFIGNDLDIVDISNPALPAQVSEVTLPGVAWMLDVQGRYVYIPDGDNGKLTIIDVADPVHPVIVGSGSAGTGAQGVAVVGKYAYVSNDGAGTLSVMDVSNPRRPVEIAETANFATNPDIVRIQGRYAYVTSWGDGKLDILDISNPFQPTLVSTVSTGGHSYNLAVNGRYAYVPNISGDTISVVDVSSSTAPFIVQTLASAAGPQQVFVSGRNAYLAAAPEVGSFGTFQTFSIQGTETASLLAHSAEAGSLMVDGSATIANNLNVASALNIGPGGILSTGALGISSTNTTSTIAYAVSSTRGIFSDYVLVNNQKVCLANGTNCPAFLAAASTLDWVYSSTNDFIRPNTNTTSLVLGGATPGTAPFYFQIQSSSSRLYLGAFGSSTNVVIGGTTSTMTNSMFQLDGNDLYAAGNIGSASSVYTNGAFITGSGTTLYGDGFISKTNGSLFVTSSQDIVLRPTGNMGVGTSTPSNKLTVVGNISNLMTTGAMDPHVLASTTYAFNALDNVDMKVQGRYMYMLRDQSGMQIFDTSDPTNPKLISDTIITNGLGRMTVYGKYAYFNRNGIPMMFIEDISNPANPVPVLQFHSVDDGIDNMAVAGNLAYIVADAPDSLTIMDITDPANPVTLSTSTGYGFPNNVIHMGSYIYLLTDGGVDTVDVRNPSKPVLVNEGTDGFMNYGVGQGTYLYLADGFAASGFRIMDISNPAAPVVASVVHTGANARGLAVAGRYMYLIEDNGKLSVWDVASSTNPINVQTTFVGSGGAQAMSVVGKYIYLANVADDAIRILSNPGTETSSLFSHSVEAGILTVDSNATIANNLNVGGSLEVGQGGIFSTGALGISSTNTTSTITYAVSSTRGIFSDYVLVNNQRVCLQNSVNCPGSIMAEIDTLASVTQRGASATNTLSLFGGATLGNNLIATGTTSLQSFSFTIATGTAVTSTNWSTTNLFFNGATGTNLTLNGSLSVATTSTFSSLNFNQTTGTRLYADVLQTPTFFASSGTFQELNFGFATGSRLALASGGLTVGGVSVCLKDGTSCPFIPDNWTYSFAQDYVTPTTNTTTGVSSTRFYVSGSIQASGNNSVDIGTADTSFGNIFTSGTSAFSNGQVSNFVSVVAASSSINSIAASSTSFILMASTTLVFATNVTAIVSQGDFLYATYGIHLLKIDVSNKSIFQIVATSTLAAGTGKTQYNNLVVDGRFAFVESDTAVTGTLGILDVASSTTPSMFRRWSPAGSGYTGIAMQGRYVFMTNVGNQNLSILDMGDPRNPIQISTTTIGTTASPVSVAVDDDYAYTANAASGTMSVISLHPITAPTILANVFTTAGRTASNRPNTVKIQGAFAYVTNAASSTFSIINIANKNAPTLVSETPVGGTSSTGLTVAGRYAYIGSATGVAIFDVSNPASPVKISVLGAGEVRDVAVKGNVLYFSDTQGSGKAKIYAYLLKGIEAMSVSASAVEAGTLTVDSRGLFNGSLNVIGGIDTEGFSLFQDAVGISGWTSSTKGILNVDSYCLNTTSATSAQRLATFSSGGDDKISFRCDGRMTADQGSIATSADYAEYFYSSANPQLRPGELAVFDPSFAGMQASSTNSHSVYGSAVVQSVTRSTASLRAFTLGVISPHGAFIGNGDLENQTSSTLVGLMGQLDVNISTLDDPQGIHVGDVLMAGDGGSAVLAHGPGVVLGTALQDFPGGTTGTLLAYVKPQWWAGDMLGTSRDGKNVMTSDVTVGQRDEVTAATSTSPVTSTTLTNSPLFSFRGKAVTPNVDGIGGPTTIDSVYSFQTAMNSATSSAFVLWGSHATSSKTALLTVSDTGDVAIGGKLELHGAAIWFDGALNMIRSDDTAIAAKGSDYATAFIADEPVESGDVVIFDLAHAGGIKKSASSKDQTVAGVISDRSGFVSGAASGSIAVAMSGKTHLKVSAENGAIHSGDLLAPSSLPGVASKMSAPGMAVAVALEDYDPVANGGDAGAVGSMSAVVQVQWSDVPPADGGAATTGSSDDGAATDAPARSGYAVVRAGDTLVHVTFESLKAYPLVLAFPGGQAGDWWIANQSDTGFDIVLAIPQLHDVTFTWTADPTPQGTVMWSSDQAASQTGVTGEATSSVNGG